MGMNKLICSLLLSFLVFTACGRADTLQLNTLDASAPVSRSRDAGIMQIIPDAGMASYDAGFVDAGQPLDSGVIMTDAGTPDQWTSDGRCIDPIVNQQPAENFVGMTIQYTPGSCNVPLATLQSELTVGSTSLTNRNGQSREVSDWTVTTPWFIGDATGVYVNLRGLHDRLPLADCFVVFSQWCAGENVPVQSRDDGFSIVWDWDARRQIR